MMIEFPLLRRFFFRQRRDPFLGAFIASRVFAVIIQAWFRFVTFRRADRPTN
jgi:hypothetical protein